MSAARSRPVPPVIRRLAVSGLRTINERTVLVTISAVPGSSAAELARMTGLGAQSVSRILVELEAAGLVMRGEARRGRRGQPAVPIYLDPEGAYAIGCEIGWRHINILITDLGGRILAQHRRDYAFPDARTIVEEVASLARLLMAIVPPERRNRVLDLCIAAPSSIARNVDLLGGSEEDRQAWQRLDLVGELEAATGLKTTIVNDGTAACWGVFALMPHPRPLNLCVIGIDTFVGAGLIAEGQLWEGPSGNAANLGSMVVTEESGRENFVHLIASIYALEKRLRDAGIAVPTGRPTTWDWDALEPVASEWIKASGMALAKVITNTTAIMEFPLAVVDGVMPRPVVERLVKSVSDAIDQLGGLTADHPAIAMGSLGDNASALGGAIRAIYRRHLSRENRDIAS